MLIVASWAVVAGGFEIAAAFGRGEPAGTRAQFILGGLVSIAFGVVRFAHPGAGAVTLALLFGLLNLIYGGWALAQGIELRHTQHTVQSAVREPHPADPSVATGQARRQVVLQQEPCWRTTVR